MKRAWPICVVLALAFVAGPAQAQSSGGLQFLFGGPGKVLSETQVPAVIGGELAVSFRGDAAAGCASYGVCSYAGTVMVRPASGSLDLVTYRLKGRIGHQATLILTSFGNGLTTSARVQRTDPVGQSGTCADARSSVFGAQSDAVIHGRSITIRLLAPGGSLLQTRCAGPVDADLASVSPTATIPLARAVRGQTTVDLSGTRAFAVHGFAGTLTSTLVIRLGRPRPGSSPSGTSFPPGIKVQRIRTVTEQLSLVRVTGGLGAAVQGTGDPIVCRLLDTCGLSGTLSLAGTPREAFATVIATAPATRPYQDFLAALGLTRSGRARGIPVAMIVSWRANVRADLSQAGATCTDTAPTGVVSVAFGALSAGASESSSLAGSWRTRCPGPTLDRALPRLSASLPPGSLGRRQFTIDVEAGASAQDDGYVIATRGHLSIRLRRGRITQHVNLQPTP